MNSSLNNRAYKEISEFLGAVNSMDKEVLKSRFGVSEPILDEICKSLEDYFLGGLLSIWRRLERRFPVGKIRGHILIFSRWMAISPGGGMRALGGRQSCGTYFAC
nr:hypothetical protein [Burkholderia gladioli]